MNLMMYLPVALALSLIDGGCGFVLVAFPLQICRERENARLALYDYSINIV